MVTGATGGIGQAVAQQAQASGAQVAGTYFSDQVQAEKLSSQGIKMIRADLSDRAQARNLIKQLLAQEGSLDGLVYCAGNSKDHTLLKLTDEEWDQVMKLHLDGLMACCQEILPSMQKKGSGKIVAIGSQAGLTGRLGQANYSAAKAATIGLIKSLAKEAGRFNVTANVVLPGFVDSKMTRATPPEAWERAKAASALGRVSSAQTVATFLVWLMSDHCDGVTGQVFQLDSRIL